MMCHLCDTKCGSQGMGLGGLWNPVGFHSRELGYLSDDLFFPLDFVFYFAIDYSFLFDLCIFSWRRIALRC